MWAGVIAIAVLCGLDELLGVGGHAAHEADVQAVCAGAPLLTGSICLLRAVTNGRERLVWAIFGVTMWVSAAGWFYYLDVLEDIGSVPYPSLADALWLPFYIGGLAALILLLRTSLERFTTTLWLDVLTGVLAAAAISAAVVVNPILHATSGDIDAVIVGLAYPTLDVLLIGVVLGMFALSGWRPGNRWIVLGVAWLVLVVVDTIEVYEIARGTWHPGTALDMAALMAQMAVAFAAWQRPRRAPGSLQFEGTATFAVPLVFTGVAVAVLIYGNFAGLSLAAVVLAVLALASSLVSTGRAYLDQRRLEGLAKTDQLTGLCNYREFHRQLDLLLARSTRTGREFAVVAMDVNGFKDVNDLRGHAEGNRVLRLVAKSIAAAKRDSDMAFRTGGDEFALLLPGTGAEGAAAAAERVGEQIARLGEDVTMACGIAAWPGDGPGKEMFLLRADVAMYSDKSGAGQSLDPGPRASVDRRAGDRGSAAARSRQASPPVDTDREQERAQLRAYAQAVRESYIQGLQRAEELKQNYVATVLTLASAVEAKDDYTGGHIHRVHDLGLLLARAVVPREADDPHLAYGFLLHDIGKLAVPDAVLNKPGKLDDQEWALMRRHPEEGVRILATIPFLGRALDVVRHHHERWDGRGYPDGLAGQDIPRWARIFAVVDTVDAITSNRPYRAGMPLEVALEEIQKGAGSQFDPECVEAFLRLDRDRVEELIQGSSADSALPINSHEPVAALVATSADDQNRSAS
jgi:two-component system, cell cycle response regulator